MLFYSSFKIFFHNIYLFLSINKNKINKKYSRDVPILLHINVV